MRAALNANCRFVVFPVACAIAAATLLGGSARAIAEESGESAPSEQPVSYSSDIEPILRKNCFGCHQGAKQLGEYRMTEFQSLVAGGESGEVAIVPGKPDESHLIQQITVVDGRAEMPKPPLAALATADVDLIRRWISEGAKDDSPADTGPRFDAENPPVYHGPPTLPSVAVTPDGKTIAIAGYYEIILKDAESGETTRRLVGESPRINSVRFSPDGKRVAAAGGRTGETGEVQIWDVESGSLLLSKQITYDTLTGASWSPDGSMLAFGATDNAVRAINSETGEQVLFQGAHDNWVLDTEFTPDGTYIVSVARDMTCKLTEVATERFIDNVTSITPGALSGGLSSVARHPERNEIVVGGADGIVKVYRVFRETARKIGDDANLIRRLPEMPGRIFNVAVSLDGSRIAAASTLDGKSEVRVWKYDFSGELDKKIKEILAKRVADRNAEEKKLVDEHKDGKTEEITKLAIGDAAVYSLAFGANHDLVVAGADGQVRILDASGAVKSQFLAVTIEPTEKKSFAVDARSWNEIQTRAYEAAAEKQSRQSPLADNNQIASISVSPETISLDSPYAYSQFVVTATLNDGSTLDVTRECDITTPAWGTASATGLVRGVSDGKGDVTVRFGQFSQTVAMTASNMIETSVDFLRDVNPVLSRLGCNQGTCHGAQAGKNGFKLSLRGYDPIYDLRALTDELAARRINPANPEESLMLRKPLGITPHQGGALMTDGDSNHAILRRWIADGSKLDLSTPRVTSLDVFPINPIASQPGDEQQVRIVAHYADGASRDVTQEAFIESGNSEVATAGKAGMLVAVRRGEAPILARYEGAYAATTLTVMGNRDGYEVKPTETFNQIDDFVAQKWERMRIVPSGLCDDNTFLRRVYLDLTGLPPTSDDVRSFIADPKPSREKRSEVIDHLIASDAFVEYWTNKWADLLQVNRKFIGVEGSEAFRGWIRTAVAENRPYDQFAREILTASGSNKENPPASYYKILRDPDATMENTTHLFMGVRFNCNKCHDHPFERWTQDQYYEMGAFFAQVGLEKDPESGNKTIGGTAVEGAKPLYEKVIDKKDGEIKHGRTGGVVEPRFPIEVTHECKEEATRREQLAAWMTDADNPYFARSYVNRLWGYMLGVGLIEPIDDIRAGNPATNPELLDYLTTSFVDSGFDTRAMLRMICNSRTYQLEVGTNSLNADDRQNYSHATPRRLPAEVLYDSVLALTGSISSIAGIPKGTRAAAFSDSGVNLPDGFLTNLGRPVRESACECERSSGLQLGPVMALISGPTIGSAISDDKNELAKIVAASPTDEAVAEEIFLRALARTPTEQELAAFKSITENIRLDHEAISEQLKTAEADWATRRADLERKRLENLELTKAEITARTEEIKPERERLEKERQDKIAAAQANVDAEKVKFDEKAEAFLTGGDTGIEWFPLAATSVKSSNDISLAPQPDRSILASGEKKDKGVYTIGFKTNLKKITGLRLEVLADPALPTKGPGLADNGNFVLTELIVKAGEASKPKELTKQDIASGKADFLQSSFAIEQTFDNEAKNQQGWAVSGATGLTHWATFKFAMPIETTEATLLSIEMHQFHNAEKHRLGRFRISVTTDDVDLPLSLPESFAAIAKTAKDKRTDADKKSLEDYLAVTDPALLKVNEELANAKKAVPPDEKLTQLQARLKSLEQETADDPAIVQLRLDVEQSSTQLKNIRLTAAEDLTWALVNSPAFLFNH